jgi:hypothetical protein
MRFSVTRMTRWLSCVYIIERLLLRPLLWIYVFFGCLVWASFTDLYHLWHFVWLSLWLQPGISAYCIALFYQIDAWKPADSLATAMPPCHRCPLCFSVASSKREQTCETEVFHAFLFQQWLVCRCHEISNVYMSLFACFIRYSGRKQHVVWLVWFACL